MAKALPLSTFSTCRKVRLVLVPLSPVHWPVSRSLSITDASPKRSAFEMTTPCSSDESDVDNLTTSRDTAEMP